MGFVGKKYKINGENMKTLLLAITAVFFLLGCSAKDGVRMSQMPIVANSDCSQSYSRVSCRDKNANPVELNIEDPKRYYEYIYQK